MEIINWKKLNKGKVILCLAGIILSLYLLAMIISGIFLQFKEYHYLDYEGNFGISNNCGVVFNQKLYCRVGNEWRPIQTYWEE